MRGSARLAVMFAAGILAASMAAPVVAEEPASIELQITVTGYVTPDLDYLGGVGGIIQCDTLGEPIAYSVDSLWADPAPYPITVGPFEVPLGSICSVEVDLEGGDPGYLAEWVWTQPDPIEVTGPSTPLAFTIERSYNGGEPAAESSDQADGWAVWVPLEVFTVDRVYINRYGAVEPEGRILCAGFVERLGHEIDPGISIGWSATQYVGRKTVIYTETIAHQEFTDCYDADNPTTPQPWHGDWLYGQTGKFGGGNIRIHAYFGDYGWLTYQWWDPDGEGYNAACEPVAEGVVYPDINGDGFCRVQVSTDGDITANLNPTRTR